MGKKYFLRGLGIGILLTTLLLCGSYRSQNSESSIVERARELGMEFPEKTPDSLIQPSPSPSQVASGQAVTGQAVTPKQKNTKQPEKTAKPIAKESTKKYSFTVRSGLLSSSVSRELKEAGLIKNAQKFDEYLEKTGLAKKLIAGDYKIPVGATEKEIAQIITGGK